MLTSGLEQEHHPGGGQQKLTEMCVCALSSEGRTFELGRGVSRTNPPCQVGGSSRPALSNDPAAQDHSLPFLPPPQRIIQIYSRSNGKDTNRNRNFRESSPPNPRQVLAESVGASSIGTVRRRTQNPCSWAMNEADCRYIWLMSCAV